MKKIILLFYILLGFTPIYAQNFEAGHYIKDGKKVAGFINYENWLKTPKTIQFKRALSEDIEILDTQSADEFEVHDEVYVSKKIKIIIDLNTTNDGNKQINHGFLEGDCFLRVFLKGNIITLLEFVDSKEKSHLFLDKDGIFQELFYSEEYHYDKDVMYLTTKKGYIGQLRALFADCHKVNISDDLPYTKKDISKLCLSYLKCNGNNNLNTIDATQNKNDRTRLSLGLIGGRFLNVDNTKNWLTGLTLKMSLPRNFNKFYLQVEGSYNSIKETSDFSIYYYPQPDDAIKVYSVSLLSGMQFGKKDFRPFINAGLSLVGKYGGNGVFGAGVSWKNVVKIEYRESTTSELRQISAGYMYNF